MTPTKNLILFFAQLFGMLVSKQTEIIYVDRHVVYHHTGDDFAEVKVHLVDYHIGAFRIRMAHIAMYDTLYVFLEDKAKLESYFND